MKTIIDIPKLTEQCMRAQILLMELQEKIEKLNEIGIYIEVQILKSSSIILTLDSKG